MATSLPQETVRFQLELIPGSGGSEDSPLTIPEAKRRLALTLGVSEASIKITIEG